MAEAIAKDTVRVVGGLGTQADNNDANGGGATKTAWDGGAPADFIAANGGPITADTGITYDHAGNGNGDRNFATAGIGTGVTVGTLAFVSGTNITTGVYEVTAVDGGGAWINMANIVATGDNGDSVVNVGGALATLQAALDDGDASTNNKYIFNNDATVDLAASIDVDVNDGSDASRIFVIGYNATLAAEAEVIITTSQTPLGGTGALVTFNGAGLQMTWRGIDFDGGDGANNAVFCIEASATTDGTSTVFENCKMHGASSDGVSMRTNSLVLVNCEIFSNGGDGYTQEASSNSLVMVACSVHDNTGHGLRTRNSSACIANNLIYDNGADGINHNEEGAETASVYLGNTLFGNGDDGIDFDSGDATQVWINNCSVGNTGVGFELSGLDVGDFRFFGYNLSGANTGGDISGGHTFATFANGNNVDSAQTADQLFTTPAGNPPVLTPESGTSDLVDAGLEASEGTAT